MQLFSDLLTLFFLLLASGFFSGFETGFVTLDRLRLLHLARTTPTKRVLLVRDYVQDMPRVLSMILTGNNLVNVAFTTSAAVFARSYFKGEFLENTFSLAAMAGVLVFGEFLPKLYFNSRPLERTLFYIPVFRTAEFLLRPVTAVAMSLTRWLSPPRAKARPFHVTREHIISLMKSPDNPAGAGITPFERYMINRVFDLQALTAEKVMTPLHRVVSIPPTASLSEALAAARASGHTILPIIDSSTGLCTGVFDSFAALHMVPEPERLPVEPAYAIPSNLAADDILPLMRRHRKLICIVQNSEKRPIGLVTQENILNLLIQGIRPHRKAAPRKAKVQ